MVWKVLFPLIYYACILTFKQNVILVSKTVIIAKVKDPLIPIQASESIHLSSKFFCEQSDWSFSGELGTQLQISQNKQTNKNCIP